MTPNFLKKIFFAAFAAYKVVKALLPLGIKLGLGFTGRALKSFIHKRMRPQRGSSSRLTRQLADRRISCRANSSMIRISKLLLNVRFLGPPTMDLRTIYVCQPTALETPSWPTRATASALPSAITHEIEITDVVSWGGRLDSGVCFGAKKFTTPRNWGFLKRASIGTIDRVTEARFLICGLGAGRGLHYGEFRTTGILASYTVPPDFDYLCDDHSIIPRCTW
jgi:hypothetical protein